MKIYVLFLLLISIGCSRPIRGLIEEPRHESGENYIQHFGYSLEYNEKYEQADWVAYQLLESETAPNFQRTNRFLADTLVKTGSAENSDYKGSGYDKGHLAPAADMTWNEQAMKESFYFSNISPQLPSFNRGIWKKLEIKVREWVMEYDCLYIATGPICTASDSTIGLNAVAVPDYFFKTILVYNDTLKQGIGFIFPNDKCIGDIFEYAVCIDSVETCTGLDFYFALPNRIEKDIEVRYDENFWR